MKLLNISKIFKQGNGDIMRLFNQALVIRGALPKHIGSVCEVGCGLGGKLFTDNLIKISDKYVGVDGYKPYFEITKKKYEKKENAKFILSDASKISCLESSQFDYVVSTEVMEHVSDDNAYVSEIARVLKKDGIAIISTPLIHKNENKKETKIDAKIDFDVFEDHKREGYLEKELVDIFYKQGFKIDNKKYCFYSPVNLSLKLLEHIYVPTFVILGISMFDYIRSIIKIGKPHDIILFLKKS